MVKYFYDSNGNLFIKNINTLLDINMDSLKLKIYQDNIETDMFDDRLGVYKKVSFSDDVKNYINKLLLNKEKILKNLLRIITKIDPYDEDENNENKFFTEFKNSDKLEYIENKSVNYDPYYNCIFYDKDGICSIIHNSENYYYFIIDLDNKDYNITFYSLDNLEDCVEKITFE